MEEKLEEEENIIRNHLKLRNKTINEHRTQYFLKLLILEENEETLNNKFHNKKKITNHCTHHNKYPQPPLYRSKPTVDC